MKISDLVPLEPAGRLWRWNIDDSWNIEDFRKIESEKFQKWKILILDMLKYVVRAPFLDTLGTRKRPQTAPSDVSGRSAACAVT